MPYFYSHYLVEVLSYSIPTYFASWIEQGTHSAFVCTYWDFDNEKTFFFLKVWMWKPKLLDPEISVLLLTTTESIF